MVLDDALDFVARGYHVFPLHAKLPIMKDWPNKASNDPDEVRDWFTGQYRSADGFGVCPKQTCVVIDVDIKKGKSGVKSLQWLISELNLPKKTFTVRTKSGGLHLYYKYPLPSESSRYVKSIANWVLRSGHVLDGIDIRGNKGQVVGPCDSNGYSILTDLPLAELPEQIIQELPIEAVHGLKDSIENTASADALVSYDQPSLGGIIPDIIHEGERHQTLLSLTASWARKVPYDSAKILLVEACKRCEGTVDPDEYMSRLDDAYAKFRPVVDDKLQYLLDHLVYITHGNRVFRKDKPHNIATIRIEEARHHYKNWLIWRERETDSGVKKSCSEAFNDWMKHPDRQMVEHIGYKPNADPTYTCSVLGAEVINTYRSPEHGDITASEKDVLPFVELVRFLWGEHTSYMLDWCAHLVQYPAKKVHWAPVLVTPFHGMGKNIFFKILQKTIGTWNASSVTAAQFNKSFNTFLVKNVLVMVNEVQEINKADRRTMMGRLKGYITESEQPIEGKGVDIYDTEIFANFIVFSNMEDALQIEPNDRRFFVSINRNMPKENEWYDSIVRWMDNTGPLYLYNWLMNRDISKFKSTGSALKTADRLEMINAGKSAVEMLVMEHVEAGYSIFTSDIVTQDSWEYYVKNVLHKGSRLSLAQERHIKKELFFSVRGLNNQSGKFISRQFRLSKISPISDNVSLIKDPIKDRTTCWTCRNHGTYDLQDSKAVSAEYDKIFGHHQSNKSLSVVN